MAQTNSTHQSFHSLTTSDMKLLTRILSHQPSPLHPYSSSTQAKYRELTKKDIAELPVHLRKESGQGKSLCKMHLGLNSDIIGSIFEWIQKQIDVSLLKSLVEPTDAEIGLSDAVMEPFLHLLDIRSMWSPTSGRRFTQRHSRRWAPQRDGCKACMLARLGGEEDIVTPLRASIIAKLDAEDKPKSRRLVWLAALIYGCFTEEVFQRIMDKSENLGRFLRTANIEAAYKKAIRPKALYIGTSPPLHTSTSSLAVPSTCPERPRSSHAVQPRRPPPPTTSRGSRVPFFWRPKTSKSSLLDPPTALPILPPPPSPSPRHIVTPTLPPVHRSSAGASSDTPPSPPPKDMSADLLQRMDSLYNAYHPIRTPPHWPSSGLPAKHTSLPRLNTDMQKLSGARHVTPFPRAERSSSVYLRSSPHVNGQPIPPIARGSIDATTETLRGNTQRNAMKRNCERPRNSLDLATTITPTDDTRGKITPITSLSTPTPDSAEEYRKLICEQEAKGLAPTPPMRHLSAERGRGRFRSKTSLHSVEELNETLEEKTDEALHKRSGSHAKFRPLSPTHMRRQFDVRLSPQSAGGHGSGGGYAMNAGNVGFAAQEKEFGNMRARLRPTVSPVDDGEYQKLIDGQRKETGVGGNGMKRASMDSFEKLYERLQEQGESH